ERLEAAVALLDGGPLLAGEYITGTRPRTLYNRMTVYTADGEGDAYVKRVPVPFGEYVPFRRWLDWFPPLEQLPNDTLPGEAAQVLDVAGARVGAVICFENTFGSLVRDQVLEGADVLVVSTNNTSFGLTPMSRQHVAFSQLRAVETGRWVVHAGLSGISGLIDPTGAMTQTTELFEQDLVRADVPLVEGMTPAMVVGNIVGWVATAVVLAALVVLAVQRWRRRDGRPAGD